MNAPYVAPRLQRSLSAAYSVLRCVLLPIDDLHPADRLAARCVDPVVAVERAARGRRFHLPLQRAHADAAGADRRQSRGPGRRRRAATTSASIRFVLTLPLPVSAPPQRPDFLIAKPLWPTTAMRPPDGETAVRGHHRSPTAQPVADLDGRDVARRRAGAAAGNAVHALRIRTAISCSAFRCSRARPGAPCRSASAYPAARFPFRLRRCRSLLGQTQIITFQRT